jgi:hypothetical protein
MTATSAPGFPEGRLADPRLALENDALGPGFGPRKDLLDGRQLRLPADQSLLDHGHSGHLHC